MHTLEKKTENSLSPFATIKLIFPVWKIKKKERKNEMVGQAPDLES